MRKADEIRFDDCGRSLADEFFRKWSKFIYREAYRCCMRNYEDVAGSVIEMISRRIAKLGPLKDGSEKWYIRRAVQLESLKYFKKDNLVYVPGYNDGDYEDNDGTITAPESDDCGDFDDRDYDLMRFESIISDCSEHQKKILRMRFVDDLTPKEIFEKTGYEQRKTSNICIYAKKNLKL